MKLAKTGSTLYLGGTDTSAYSGSIEYHSVSRQVYWQIGNGKVVVGNKVRYLIFRTLNSVLKAHVIDGRFKYIHHYRLWYHNHLRPA